MDCYKQRDRCKTNYLLNIMTSATDTDIREIKDLIGAGNDAIQKQIADLGKKIDDVKTDIKVMDTRLIEVEKKIDKQDNRLWAFGGIVLAATLGGLWKLLG
jgi:phosphoribosylaminoimidazole-succinocarboxamide synthase